MTILHLKTLKELKKILLPSHFIRFRCLDHIKYKPPTPEIRAIYLFIDFDGAANSRN